MVNSTPFIDARTGVATPYGVLFPPGARVRAYVRGTTAGALAVREGDEAIRPLMVASIAAGLARCKSGYPDIVFVLPGHAENCAAAGGLAKLVPGCFLIGLGDPEKDNGPTVNFTDTLSNWAIDDKNVTIAGLRFVAAADPVTAMLTFSAAGCRFIGNMIVTATSATLECTTPITVAAGATSLKLLRNKSRGVTGATTQVVLVSGAADDIEIAENDLQMPGGSAAIGCIHFSAAATNIRVCKNTLSNSKSDSTAGLSIATATAVTGKISDNDSIIYADGVAAATGILFAGTPSATVRCFRNYTCDEPRVSGVLSPAGCAT
jgi:hypothetical protein